VLLPDFDLLPSKAAEALPIIRLRLRKLVPFEVEMRRR
jgi:type IV pilus assembly protein PilM